MVVFNDCKKIKGLNPVVTMGTFDGVHLGHQVILQQLHETAVRLQSPSMVLTFWPHPRMIVQKGLLQMKLLNSLNEKIRLIEQQGIDYLLILPFTEDFSKLSSFEFIEQILHKKIGTRAMVVGYDHRFGSDRQGNLDVLRHTAARFGIEVEKVNELKIQNHHTSSTQIRQALDNANIALANQLLGYHYTLEGTVETGYQNGRKIGFPTANIRIDENYKLIPANGVYAGHVYIADRQYMGMLNIGRRPTFENGNHKSIEVHILYFSGNIYNSFIRLEVTHFLRHEKKFRTALELKQQLQTDSQQTQILLKKY